MFNFNFPSKYEVLSFHPHRHTHTATLRYNCFPFNVYVKKRFLPKNNSMQLDFYIFGFFYIPFYIDS